MTDTPKYTWQYQKAYPNSGQMFDADGEIVDVADYYRKGNPLKIWPFGETMTGYKVDDITLQFQYPFINEDFDFRPPVITGDGVVQQSNSMLQVSSVTGSASVKSRSLTSYRPGHSGYIDFTAMFSGTGQAIVGGDDAFQLQSTHLDDPNFAAVYETSGDCTLSSGSFAAGTIGAERTTGFRTFSFPSSPIVGGVGLDEGDVSLTGSDVLTIAIIRSKDVYQTIDNSVAAFLYRWENYANSPDTGAGEVVFQIILNPILTGTPTYTDIDTQNSTLQIDHTAGTGASVSYSSGGRVILQKQIPYLAGQGNKPGVGTFSAIEAEQIGAILTAGDTICIVAKDKGGNGVDVRTSLSWRERF